MLLEARSSSNVSAGTPHRPPPAACTSSSHLSSSPSTHPANKPAQPAIRRRHVGPAFTCCSAASSHVRHSTFPRLHAPLCTYALTARRSRETSRRRKAAVCSPLTATPSVTAGMLHIGRTTAAKSTAVANSGCGPHRPSPAHQPPVACKPPRVRASHMSVRPFTS